MIPARPMLSFFARCLIILTCLGTAPTHSESATPEETGLKIAQDSRARKALATLRPSKSWCCATNTDKRADASSE